MSTLPSLRNGPPSRDPRKHGNVYQLEASRIIAEKALFRSDEALREVRMIRYLFYFMLAGIFALAFKVCL